MVPVATSKAFTEPLCGLLASRIEGTGAIMDEVGMAK